jgi:hypothetical protein
VRIVEAGAASGLSVFVYVDGEPRLTVKPADSLRLVSTSGRNTGSCGCTVAQPSRKPEKPIFLTTWARRKLPNRLANSTNTSVQLNRTDPFRRKFSIISQRNCRMWDERQFLNPAQRNEMFMLAGFFELRETRRNRGCSHALRMADRKEQ